MSDRIDSMTPREFITLLQARIFTDDEVVQWIRAHRVSGQEKVDLLTTIAQLKGGTVGGPIRTALREVEGLPPIPGDDA
jgi:hypothetical protein